MRCVSNCSPFQSKYNLEKIGRHGMWKPFQNASLWCWECWVYFENVGCGEINMSKKRCAYVCNVLKMQNLSFYTCAPPLVIEVCVKRQSGMDLSQECQEMLITMKAVLWIFLVDLSLLQCHWLTWHNYMPWLRSTTDIHSTDLQTQRQQCSTSSLSMPVPVTSTANVCRKLCKRKSSCWGETPFFDFFIGASPRWDSQRLVRHCFGFCWTILFSTGQSDQNFGWFVGPPWGVFGKFVHAWTCHSGAGDHCPAPIEIGAKRTKLTKPTKYVLTAGQQRTKSIWCLQEDIAWLTLKANWSVSQRGTLCATLTTTVRMPSRHLFGTLMPLCVWKAALLMALQHTLTSMVTHGFSGNVNAKCRTFHQENTWMCDSNAAGGAISRRAGGVGIVAVIFACGALTSTSGSHLSWHKHAKSRHAGNAVTTMCCNLSPQEGQL